MRARRIRKITALLACLMLAVPALAGADGMGFGGGMGGGSRGGSKQGSGTTPGKALTIAHALGTGDMTVYGTVQPETEEPVQALTLEDGTVGLACGNGTFTAAAEDGTLILAAEENTEWTVCLYYLQALNRSGYGKVKLVTPAGESELSTDLTLSGRIYGQERAAGFVSGDFTLRSDGEKWTVTVEDRTYDLEQGELKAQEASQEEEL